MSTTPQLEKWAAKNIPFRFYGVFSANTLPSPIEFCDGVPTSLIVNYDLSNMAGSHWVSVYATENELSWFDSFGLAPDSDDLLLGHRTYFHRWLEQVCHRLGLKKYSWNTADLQSLNETTCGHYSAYFCKNGPKKGWSQFGSNRAANDQLVRKLVQL